MNPKFTTWNDGTRNYSLRIENIRLLSSMHGERTNEISLVRLSKEEVIQFIQDLHLEWARAQAHVDELEPVK